MPHPPFGAGLTETRPWSSLSSGAPAAPAVGAGLAGTGNRRGDSAWRLATPAVRGGSHRDFRSLKAIARNTGRTRPFGAGLGACTGIRQLSVWIGTGGRLVRSRFPAGAAPAANVRAAGALPRRRRACRKRAGRMPAVPGPAFGGVGVCVSRGRLDAGVDAGAPGLARFPGARASRARVPASRDDGGEARPQPPPPNDPTTITPAITDR